MTKDELAQSLRRKINQARLNYAHCMDCRLYDLAEKARQEINAAVAALNAIAE